MFKFKTVKTIFWICGVLIILALVLYFLKFNGGLSSDSDDWGNFGDYLNAFLSVINLILLVTLSLITYSTTERYNRLQLRPHIYIVQDKTENISISHRQWTWQMLNRSAVPAMNVLVRFKSDNKWSNWVICFSLGKEMHRELFWIYNAVEIEVCYTDIENKNFYLYHFVDYTGTEVAITGDEFKINVSNARKLFFPNTNDLINTNNLTEHISSVINNNYNPATNAGAAWVRLQSLIFLDKTKSVKD